MWLVRLRMRNARPWARGWNRLRVAPSSTNAVVMTSSSATKRSPYFSASTRALAIADSTSLRTGSAAVCGLNRRTWTASVARLPRTRSTTRRAFMGVTRRWRTFAVASISGS